MTQTCCCLCLLLWIFYWGSTLICCCDDVNCSRRCMETEKVPSQIEYASCWHFRQIVFHELSSSSSVDELIIRFSTSKHCVILHCCLWHSMRLSSSMIVGVHEIQHEFSEGKLQIACFLSMGFTKTGGARNFITRHRRRALQGRANGVSIADP